jgi:hypothetical protein
MDMFGFTLNFEMYGVEMERCFRDWYEQFKFKTYLALRIGTTI